MFEQDKEIWVTWSSLIIIIQRNDLKIKCFCDRHRLASTASAAQSPLPTVHLHHRGHQSSYTWLSLVIINCFFFIYFFRTSLLLRKQIGWFRSNPISHITINSSFSLSIITIFFLTISWAENVTVKHRVMKNTESRISERFQVPLAIQIFLWRQTRSVTN